MTTAEVLSLRPAERHDVAALAEVHVVARTSAPMPPMVHPPHDVRRFLGDRLQLDEVWVAEAAGEVVGYVRFTDTWLDDLYVRPEWAGRGVGSALLDLVKSLRPGGFGLWVFEMNVPARAFYAHRGLVEVERTDGSGNEEGEADIRMEWSPA